MTKRSSKPVAGEAPKLAPLAKTAVASQAEVAETVVSIAIQAGVPVFLYSEPGVGKSSVVRALSEDMKTRLHTIMLSVREPTDQGGLPAVFEEKGEKLVRIIPPGWARDLIRDKGGVVFFDEISNATPATMNSALRVVQEGVVGDGEKLPSATSFVLAGNPPETNVGANEITAGIANRCVHVRWPFDYERWRAGMLSRWRRNRETFPTLPADWREGVDDMVALVVAFLDTRTNLAQAQPTDIGEQSKAWPSGRTWELSATMLAAAQSIGHGPKSVVAKTIVGGLVGEAALREWSSWIVEMDLPKTEDVMDDPTGFKMPARQDQILVVLSGVVSYVARHSGDVDVYQRAWSVMNRVLEQDASLAIRATRDLGALMPPGADKTGSPFYKGLALVKAHLGTARVDFGGAS